jgi:hypothetical protein
MATFVSRKSLSSATLIDEIPARIHSVVKWSVAPIAALSALAQRFNLYAGIGAHLRVLPNGYFVPHAPMRLRFSGAMQGDIVWTRRRLPA